MIRRYRSEVQINILLASASECFGEYFKSITFALSPRSTFAGSLLVGLADVVCQTMIEVGNLRIHKLNLEIGKWNLEVKGKLKLFLEVGTEEFRGVHKLFTGHTDACWAVCRRLATVF